MKVGISVNKAKVTDEKTVSVFLDRLEREGYETVLFSETSEIKDVDVVIALGGDGAILHAAVEAAQKNIKVIGVNYGHLGFLAEYEKDEVFQTIDLLADLKRGVCPVFRRSMLELSFDNRRLYALNEVLIQRDYGIGNTQLIQSDVRVNGDPVERFSGDGLLVSTPTGSTAYALSAGGAILTPDVPAIMLTPVCAFSLNARPIVFPDTAVFEIGVSRGHGMIVADGKKVASVSEGTTFQVKKAAFSADFPMRGNSGLFKKIRTKLNQ